MRAAGPYRNPRILTGQVLEATPDHRLLTRTGPVPISKVALGDETFCFNTNTQACEHYTVLRKYEYASGEQSVCNLVAILGSLLLNGIMALQK